MANVQENALRMLRLVYEETRGDPENWFDTEPLLGKLALSQTDGRAAAGYLISKGLLKQENVMGVMPTVSMTARGIEQIEDALKHPNRPTPYLPAVTYVFNQNIVHGNANNSALQAGSTASPITLNNQSRIDLRALAEQLEALRQALKQEATTAEHDVAVGHIAAASMAAKNQDAEQVKASLGKLGQVGGWVLDKADKLSLLVAIEAIKLWWS